MMSFRLERQGFLVLALGILLILPGRAAAALSGGWGCLGQFTFGFNNGAAVNFVATYVDQMQLNVNSSNGVSGTMFFGNGEVCDFPVVGSIAPGTNGIGTLTLSFVVAANKKDEDNDLLCSQFFGRTGQFTAHFRIVTTNGNTKFSFFGKDDFFTIVGAPSDSGDFNTISGYCDHQ